MMLSRYTGGSDSVKRRFLLTLAGVLGRGPTSRLLANPEGLTVASGSASVQQQGSSLNLTVSQGTLLNWQHFNIRPGEITTFYQSNCASLESQNLSPTDVSTLKVGGNVSLNAGRNTEAIVVARGSLNVRSVQSANVVALASGGTSLSVGGSVTVKLVSGTVASARGGDGISANLISQNVHSSSQTSAEVGVVQTTAARSDSKASLDACQALASNDKDLMKDEEERKKRPSSSALLKRSAGCVTVILSQN